MKVSIWQEWKRGGTNITFYNEQDGKMYVAKPVELEFYELKDGESHEPTLAISRRMNEKEFFQSVIDEINILGFKPKSESFLEGELKATKFHLQDVRIMLKLK